MNAAHLRAKRGKRRPFKFFMKDSATGPVAQAPWMPLAGLRANHSSEPAIKSRLGLLSAAKVTLP